MPLLLCALRCFGHGSEAQPCCHMKPQGARKDLITLRNWTRSRTGKASWFWLRTFLEWVSGLMLEVLCCSQAVQGAARRLLVHLLSASSWVPVPRSHASPFHCCSFSPQFVTEHLVSIRQGATSVPYQCPYIPPPHPLWQPVPPSSRQLRRMKIVLKRPVPRKSSLWMCLDPFPWDELRSLQCSPLPPLPGPPWVCNPW